MEAKELTIVLAALLHDIGKIHRRTGLKKAHEELSEIFVRNYVPEFEYKNHLSRIVKYHHGKNIEKDAEIVKSADSISAAEREIDRDKSYEEGYESEWRRLQHIFVGENASRMFYYKVQPLDLKSNLENLYGEEREESTSIEYGELWNTFIEDVEVLESLYRNGSLNEEGYLKSYIVTLSELLRRYCIFVPSAPTIEEEVRNSLYAHLKTSAALTFSILMNLENKNNENIFTLIMGDVAGIQRYVYGSRMHGGALKMLRSRSIYVSLLTEAIARHIINRLGLSPLNILFCSGGQFMILSHYIEEDKLNRIFTEIENFLIKRHEGNIGLRLSYVKLTKEDFKNRDRFVEKLNEAQNKLSEAGLTLFKNISAEYFEEVFGPLKIREEVCYSCGSVRDVEAIKEDEKEIKLCKLCREFKELAKELASAKYLLVLSWSSDIGGNVGNATIDEAGIYTGPLNFAVDGLYSSYHIVRDFEKVVHFLQLLDKIGLKPLDVSLIKLNDTDISEVLRKLANHYSDIPFPISVGFKFITKHTPLEEDGSIKSFDKIAKESKGSKLIGYLKLDLDSIGEIRGSRCKTLSDILTFSEILSTIMEGAVDYLVTNILEKGFSEKLYLIYSGGDDLFIVGSWDATIESLEKLYERFENMLRIGYDAPTISAAIHFEDPKTPVKIASEKTSTKLRKVKEEGKDGIIITDEKINWNGFKECLKISKELAKYVEDGLIPRGLIFDLYRLIIDYKKDYEKTWSIYRYRLRYILSRNLSKDMVSRVEGAFIKSLPDVSKEILKKEIMRNFRHLTDITILVENYTRMEADKL